MIWRLKSYLFGPWWRWKRRRLKAWRARYVMEFGCIRDGLIYLYDEGLETGDAVLAERLHLHRDDVAQPEPGESGFGACPLCGLSLFYRRVPVRGIDEWPGDWKLVGIRTLQAGEEKRAA